MQDHPGLPPIPLHIRTHSIYILSAELCRQAPQMISDICYFHWHICRYPGSSQSCPSRTLDICTNFSFTAPPSQRSGPFYVRIRFKHPTSEFFLLHNAPAAQIRNNQNNQGCCHNAYPDSHIAQSVGIMITAIRLAYLAFSASNFSRSGIIKLRKMTATAI